MSMLAEASVLISRSTSTARGGAGCHPAACHIIATVSAPSVMGSSVARSRRQPTCGCAAGVTCRDGSVSGQVDAFVLQFQDTHPCYARRLRKPSRALDQSLSLSLVKRFPAGPPPALKRTRRTLSCRRRTRCHQYLRRTSRDDSACLLPLMLMRAASAGVLPRWLRPPSELLERASAPAPAPAPLQFALSLSSPDAHEDADDELHRSGSNESDWVLCGPVESPSICVSMTLPLSAAAPRPYAQVAALLPLDSGKKPV